MGKSYAILMVIASIYVINARADDKDQFLASHNTSRANVGVAAIQWNDTLAAYAATYAQSQISNCINGILVHSGGPYGENLFWGSGKNWSPTEAVQSWVNEAQYYTYSTNTCASGHVCGHYTQVVWRASTNLGCAKLICESTRPTIYVICSYYPRGNIIGQWPY